MPEDFIPDFTSKLTTGVICNRHSKIMQVDHLSYISLFNRINVWHIRTQELVFSFGTQKHQISCFIVEGGIALIGYENGVVEIVRNYESVMERSSRVLKLHSKKVTHVQKVDDFVISSSSDGTLCAYDLLLEEIKLYFEGNSASICHFFADQDRILAACADKTVKMWRLSSGQVIDAVAFDEHVFAVVARGNEALVILMNGDSNLLSLETKEKRQFERFKNQRKLLLKDGKVIVQCQKKTILYSISSKHDLGLAPFERMSTSQDYVDLDYVSSCVVFISRKNKIQYGSETIDFGFHEEEILDIRIDHNKVFTLSKDRIVYWIRGQENPFEGAGKVEDIQAEEEQYVHDYLDLHSFVAVKDATCLELFDDFIVIGSSKGIRMLSRKFFELGQELPLGNVLSLSAFGSVLAVSIGTAIRFYDPTFQEVGARDVPDTITCSRFSEDGTLFVCSCIDNKVYVFTYPSMELKTCLYGHSLPVRRLDISRDSKLLLTAGADKLIKIWGLEFGECRKTLLGNSRSVEFINNTLFMFCDRGVEYYDGSKKLKSFKVFSPGLIKFGTDYMIATSDRGLNLFTMNRYELIVEEGSSEIEAMAIKTVANVRDYDAFLDHLHRIEKDPSASATSEFYAFLEGLDISELKEYMYVLDHVFIRLILGTLEANISKNPIINTRILMILLKGHRNACLSSSAFYRIRDELLEKVRDLRNLYYTNEASFEIDASHITY